jgi:formylglycine-generating enzyme required for sulfatase activity
MDYFRRNLAMKRSLSFFSVVLVLFYLLALLHPAKAQAPKEITNSIGMKLVLIPKGTFMMGSPETEKGRQENETQHEVTISKDYYLGVHEVTQAQYEKVMGKNPSHFQGAIVGNENADLPLFLLTTKPIERSPNSNNGCMT